MRSRTFAFLVLLMAFPALCAAKEMMVRVDVPSSASGQQAFERSVFIRQATDNRSFEGSTASPETPSWGSTNTAFTTPAVQSHSIARNAEVGGKDFGGNILLEGDQTVESLLMDATSAAFARAEYSVLNGGTPPEGVPVVDIEIDKLWGRFIYKRFASEIATEIDTRVVIRMPDGQTKTLTVRASYRTSALHFSRENWEKVFGTLMTSYVTGLEGEIRKLDK